MEILNSGSFIPLDNRERIEQLIFTAQTLASEVHQNAGFHDSGQTSQQIGLELWNGAEYMTRSHEEVTIRNIFLSKFLERLRDIERKSVQQSPTPVPPPNPPAIENITSNGEATSAESNAVIKTDPVEAEDEFLGVVDEQESYERPSYANECKPECEEEIVSANVKPTIDQIIEENSAPTQESTIPIEESKEHNSILSVTGVEATLETTALSDESGSDDIIGAEQSVRSVVLFEKEPYNFDTCTVTAVIQLLPGSNGSRDCVISVRSHDFAPEVRFTNRWSESGELNPSGSVVAALERYRNSLPILAAEKMKKEQAAAKKRTPKTASKTPDKAAEKADTNADSSSTSNSIPQEPAKDQQSLFAS